MPTAIVDMSVLTRNWWAVLVRGLVAVAFGLVTFFAPGLSLAALVLVFGVYVIFDGVFALVSVFRRRHSSPPSVLLALEGVTGIAAGIVTLFFPGVTALALLYLIAVWAILTGILEIAAAIRFRASIRGEWLLAIVGALSIVFGIALFASPAAGALAVVLWIGAYAFVFGALLIALAVRLRALSHTHIEPSAPFAPPAIHGGHARS